MPANECGFSLPTIGVVSKYEQRTIPGYANTKNSKDSPGNEEWSGRVGQPPGPSKIKAPLTLVEGSIRPSNGIPSGRCRRDVTKAATGRQIARNSQPWEGRRLQSAIQSNRTV